MCVCVYVCVCVCVILRRETAYAREYIRKRKNGGTARGVSHAGEMAIYCYLEMCNYDKTSSHACAICV